MAKSESEFRILPTKCARTGRPIGGRFCYCKEERRGPRPGLLVRRGYGWAVEDVVARGSDAGWAFREPLAAWSETRLRAFVGTIPASVESAAD